MKTIYPIILAGGIGTRLWPLSRKSFPKQFSKLIGDNSLFQESALRCKSSRIASFAKPIIITNSEFRFIVVDQLHKQGIDPGAIIIEPQSKNTAPAILAAILFSISKNHDSIFLVIPSDHMIPETLAFHSSVSIGLNELQKGNIVTFGIFPNRPETGYGYLSLSRIPKKKPVSVTKFIEKPNINDANTMINEGKCLWNSGIFLFRGQDLIESFKKNSPKFITPVKNAIENGWSDLGFFRLDPLSWQECQNISIDYAIMEKINNLVAVPYSNNWSDLGSWDAVWCNMPQDSSGVALSENAYAIDCKNSLIRSESKNQEIVGLGLQNIIAISMRDAVLVANKDRVQDVKKVVQILKNKNKPQSETFTKDFRPWGSFESLLLKNTFQVKCISVNSNAALSLQSHKFRSEHWVIVKGIAKITIDKNTRIIGVGDYVFVPQGAVHRLENPGKKKLVMIEVQIGNYLGEDDIVRYEDLYARE